MASALTVLAVDSTGSGLDRLNLDSGGALKVDLAGSSGGAIAADVSIVADSVGLATEATLLAQATETTLSTVAGDTTSIDGKTPALGSALSAASVPVVIASDQSAVPVSVSSGSATATTVFSAQSITAGSTATSTSVDLDTVASPVSVLGNFDDFSAQIVVQFSADNSTWYSTSLIEYVDMSTGDFGFSLQPVGARYVRLSATNTALSSKTITAIISYKS